MFTTNLYQVCWKALLVLIIVDIMSCIHINSYVYYQVCWKARARADISWSSNIRVRELTGPATLQSTSESPERAVIYLWFVPLRLVESGETKRQVLPVPIYWGVLIKIRLAGLSVIESGETKRQDWLFLFIGACWLKSSSVSLNEFSQCLSLTRLPKWHSNTTQIWGLNTHSRPPLPEPPTRGAGDRRRSDARISSQIMGRAPPPRTCAWSSMIPWCDSSLPAPKVPLTPSLPPVPTSCGGTWAVGRGWLHSLMIGVPTHGFYFGRSSPPTLPKSPQNEYIYKFIRKKYIF